MTETGDTFDSSQVENDYQELQDNLTSYEIASATERQERDRLVATWRDLLHSYLKMVGSDPRIIHKVIDSMDSFLNHAGGRRK
jgi:hypothetical protein